jgi:hypothetical protein
MVDWLDPTTWQVGVKTAASIVSLGERLRKLMTRKGGGSKSGGVNTTELSDSLAKVLKDMLDLMLQASHNEQRIVEGISEILKDLNHRIGVLERAALQKKPRKSASARRKPVKRKRRT